MILHAVLIEEPKYNHSTAMCSALYSLRVCKRITEFQINDAYYVIVHSCSRSTKISIMCSYDLP